jgi:hypothetical protein
MYYYISLFTHTTKALIFTKIFNHIAMFLSIRLTDAGEIYGLKSIAAYRSGLEINTNVTRQDAEEGLGQVLLGE